MVFIEHQNGELVERLAKENASKEFPIFEDAPVKGWAAGEDDWNWDVAGQCPCNVCMLMRGQSKFLAHLEELVEEHGWEGTSSVSTGWETKYDEDDIPGSTEEAAQSGLQADGDNAELPTLNLPSLGGAADLDDSSDPPSSPVPRPFSDHGTSSAEGEQHYGRIIPGLGSSGVPSSWDQTRERKHGHRKILPTDEEF